MYCFIQCVPDCVSVWTSTRDSAKRGQGAAEGEEARGEWPWLLGFPEEFLHIRRYDHSQPYLPLPAGRQQSVHSLALQDLGVAQLRGPFFLSFGVGN